MKRPAELCALRSHSWRRSLVVSAGRPARPILGYCFARGQNSAGPTETPAANQSSLHFRSLHLRPQRGGGKTMRARCRLIRLPAAAASAAALRFARSPAATRLAPSALPLASLASGRRAQLSAPANCARARRPPGRVAPATDASNNSPDQTRTLAAFIRSFNPPARPPGVLCAPISARRPTMAAPVQPSVRPHANAAGHDKARKDEAKHERQMRDMSSGSLVGSATGWRRLWRPQRRRAAHEIGRPKCRRPAGRLAALLRFGPHLLASKFTRRAGHFRRAAACEPEIGVARTMRPTRQQ